MSRVRVLALLLMLAGTTIAASAQGVSAPRYLAPAQANNKFGGGGRT